MDLILGNDVFDYIMSYLFDYKDMMNISHVCRSMWNYKYTNGIHVYGYKQQHIIRMNKFNIVTINILDNLQRTDIKYLTNVTTLIFSIETASTSHKFINDYLRYMPSLTRLHLGNNQTISDDGLLLLPNLISLDCAYSRQLTDKSLMCLKNLQYLDCSYTAHLFTDTILNKLTQLKYLNCSGNLIFKKLSLPSLTYLDCSGCENITDIGYNPELIYLDCSSCTFQINSYPNLTYLDCSECDYIDNEVLQNMPDLIILDCSHMDNYDPNFGINSLKKLKYLDYGLLNRDISERISKLYDLIYLGYGVYNLEYTIEHLNSLSKLKYLSCMIEYNDIEYVNFKSLTLNALMIDGNYHLKKSQLPNNIVKAIRMRSSSSWTIQKSLIKDLLESYGGNIGFL